MTLKFQACENARAGTVKRHTWRDNTILLVIDVINGINMGIDKLRAM